MTYKFPPDLEKLVNDQMVACRPLSRRTGKQAFLRGRSQRDFSHAK
jgi:hypothetical protein